MAETPLTKPVGDQVPQVGDVAVGEDLEFQRRWWLFERVIWILFLLLLVADMLGVFGRGWAARAKLSQDDGALTVDYERVERAGTPSILTVHLGDGAIQDGKVRLFVSEDVVRALGAQRISPQPLESMLASEGMIYSFPAAGTPATVEFQLQPSFPGRRHFQLGLADGKKSPPLRGSILVLP